MKTKICALLVISMLYFGETFQVPAQRIIEFRKMEVTFNTMITLLSQVRRGPITVTTAEAAVPSTGIGTAVRISATINATDYVNTSLSLKVDLYRSLNSGSTWEHVAGFGWVGGPAIGKGGAINPDPYVQVDSSLLIGKMVRCEVSIPKSMRTGITLSY
jgi:hypothetical protein